MKDLERMRFRLVVRDVFTLPLLFNWQDEQQEGRTISIALANIAIYAGVVVCERLANRFWRRKLQQEDWDGGYRALKCSPG